LIMGKFNYSANWGKNYDPSLFGEALNVYRNSGMFSAAPSAQASEESALGKALAEAKKHGVTLDSSSLGAIALAGALGPPKQPGYFEPGGDRQKLEDVMRMRREEANYAQKLGKESAREALLLSSISKIGPTLATALGGPSWDTIERNRETGLNAINNIKQSTLQPLSTAQFQPRSYYS